MRLRDLARWSAAVSFGLLIPRPVPAAEHYQWKSVAIHGGGFVSGLVTCPTAPGLYARTDVGGAYRFDNDKWIPLTDWVGQDDGNLMGCESIAVDPSEPDRIYLALGTYTNEWAGNGAIVRSADRGKTFDRVDMPFKMGGNDSGRSVGERLAVDPDDGRVLFFGARANGLWRSDDRAKSWKRVDTFPAVATSPAAADPAARHWAWGIGFVVFDSTGSAKGAPTKTLYAGVCTKETSLFRSTDGGTTWTAVPNQPTGLRPNHMTGGAGGRYFLSYADDAGPNDCRDGAIYSFDSTTDQWTDVTPVKPSPADSFGYGAVSADPRHDGVLMASSLDRWSHGDTVFRSIDAGRHWASILVGGNHRDRSLFSSPDAPWAQSMSPHWLGSVQIDPFDSDRFWFVTGYGVWTSHDVTAADAGKPVHWSFADDGLEEVVPIAIVSPPAGAHLLSAIGDFDGFKHDDLDVSPKGGRHQPSVGTTSALDFAENDPRFVVRAGGHGQGFYSTDGGDAWTPFASTPGHGRGGGVLAVSADGAAVIWRLDPGGLFRSGDRGNSWAACQGPSPSARPVADRSGPAGFYAVEDSGRVWVAADSGKTFALSEHSLPRGVRCVRSVPGHAGELWACADHRLFRWTATGAAAVTSVTTANQIGFGKPAAGGTYPAVFLAGKVGEVTGLFRSDDAGLSWFRIDDAGHQFGWINVITGDPRVFGRVYVGTSGRGIVYGESK